MDAAGARPYLETACWRAELAERLGLPTRPAREEYDVFRGVPSSSGCIVFGRGLIFLLDSTAAAKGKGIALARGVAR